MGRHHYHPAHSLPGMIWNFICLFILVPTHLPGRNGVRVAKQKIFLTHPNLIASNGHPSPKLPEPKASSSLPNTMMDFVCGPAIFPNILSGKANGKREKGMY